MDSSIFSSLNRLIRTIQSHHAFSAVRSYSSRGTSRKSLFSKIAPLGNPNLSIVPALDGWIDAGKTTSVAELQRIIRDLRKRNRYGHALEVRYFRPSFSFIASLKTPKHYFRLAYRQSRNFYASADICWMK